MKDILKTIWKGTTRILCAFIVVAIIFIIFGGFVYMWVAGIYWLAIPLSVVFFLILMYIIGRG